MYNKMNIKHKISIMASITMSIMLSITNVYAYTVDDVRDLVGSSRIDDIYTESEIAEIIENYNRVERANLIAKMFEMGKVINVDKKTEEEYIKLDKEVTNLKEQLLTSYMGGGEITEVLSAKTELESTLHKSKNLKEKGIAITLDYVENKWAEDYIKVQDTIAKMSKDYEIGELGEGMRSPVYGGFLLTSPFGFRLDPITQDELTFHNGIDLAADLDDTVLAQWNGVVSSIYESETGGKTIEITHGEGLVSKYLHLNSISVQVGQEVRQYEVIGSAGTTGTRSTGVHLHFTVELDGEKINPIYLYGRMGLNAFKTYISYNPEKNRELLEIESNIKIRPTKENEIEEEKRPRYERVQNDIPEGSIKSNDSTMDDVNPYSEGKGLDWNIYGDVKVIDEKSD